MPEVFVGIGTNVEPEAHVQLALAEFRGKFGPITVSPVYRNPAVGFDGADFLNLVVGFTSELEVPELVDVLHALEKRCGRKRSEERWGPRTLDLDLLIYGNEVRDRPPLPRADVLKRAFVLRPLADIAPDSRHPVNGKTYAELWARFTGETNTLSRVILPEPLLEHRADSMSKSIINSHRDNLDGNNDEKLT